MKVLKFGGSSVANAENTAKVIEIVSDAAGRGRCLVVFSALRGTTDALIAAGNLARVGDAEFGARLTAIAANHADTINALFAENDAAGIRQTVAELLADLESILEGVSRVRELTPRTLDRILSFGELASSRIISAALSARGVANEWIDSRGVIRTDSTHGHAAVDLAGSMAAIEAAIDASQAQLFIAPGFIAADEEGNVTTLGRGGSDYSAAIFAAALDADLLEIWTDVSGMMSADPRFVRNVRQIPHINYREAMELSHFGAKVIYPPTIHPVMSKGIPLLVKNTFAPEDAGTLIESDPAADGQMVRGISSIDNIAVLNLEGSGMVGIPGFSKRLFGALSQAEINVILITQSSSEHSICVAVDEASADLAKRVVDREFEYEISQGRIDPLRVERGFAILALVGDRMKEHTGVSGKMFTTLGQNGINIHAIAQGSSERNISAIIGSADVRKALNTLHEEFFSDGLKQINLYIVGVGNVGSRLLEQLRRQRDHLADELGLNVRVVGLANSKRSLFDEEGLDLEHWQELLAVNYGDPASGDLAELLVANNLRNSIFVDVTASPRTVEVYPQLLRRSVSVIACNKIAASSSLEDYAVLRSLAREFNTNFLFETNVGAGLPVINTLNDLVRSGDRVERIEAVLSGTLNFVFNNYDGSEPFAEVVRRAQAEGYTEPDPRLDLSGTDVARKILILAREAGYGLEMEDVANEPFLPEECFAGSVEDFYAAMADREPHFRGLLDNAESAGRKLKYIATLENGKASVGLREIGPDHDFAKLSGKDNAVLFYTKRYSEQPLVIKGAGAGADVTAAGVFADIIRAAR